MPQKAAAWTTISLHPLMGMLDTRSRPADLPNAAFRRKESFAASPEGKLCRRSGFDRAFADLGSNNWDHHHQGATRQPIIFGWEATRSDGTRFLFDGTQSRVSYLNQTTGVWTDILTGQGATGSYWTAAALQDLVILANGVNLPQYLDLNNLSAGMQNLSDLTSSVSPHVGVTTAKIAIEYQGCVFLMDVTQGGVHYPTRIRWSDLNDATRWHISIGDSDPAICGYQDLPYGDEIMAAAILLGNLYVFTRRAIWQVNAAGATASTWGFGPVYSEPLNQTGCLVYPFTLVSDGLNFWYMSRDGIYKWNPYLAQPVRDDWLHRADGVIFTKADTQMQGAFCNVPVAQYNPSSRELWISWAGPGATDNNLTLIAQLEQKTADVVRQGFTCMVNYRRNAATGVLCNEIQDLLCVSGADWCWKSIGGVFFYELAVMTGDLTDDLPLVGQQYSQIGYYSILSGLIPLGYNDRDKIVRKVMLDDDTSEQDQPCLIRVRIGAAYNMVDPSDMDNFCAPLWHFIGLVPLACSDTATLSAMQAAGQRPNVGKEWNTYDIGRFLYFEITIENPGGTATEVGPPAIGGDTCFNRIDFQAKAMPLPA